MKDLNAIFVFWVEYRRELHFPSEGVFEAARDDNYFRSIAVLFRKKTNTKKRWEDEHLRCECKLEESKVFVFVFNKHCLHTTWTWQIFLVCKLKVKCQRIKGFLKGMWNSKLTRGDFMAHVIVLRFLLVKKTLCQSIPHMCFIMTMAL